MSEQDYEQLTLFPADSPASRFPWQESKKEKGTIVTYGLRCSELSESCARIALSVRTFLESSGLPPGKWSRIWSMKGITSSCSVLKLRLSERGTGERECSLWPTPRANEGKDVLQSVPPSRQKEPGKCNLTNAVAMRLLTTPCAADATGTTGGKNHRSLRTDVAGQLNPMWVEWLQGFPIGWTDLNASETR